MIQWMNEKNIKLVEQPMPKEQVDDLLDLILKKDENQEYYEEILRIITN